MKSARNPGRTAAALLAAAALFSAVPAAAQDGDPEDDDGGVRIDLDEDEVIVLLLDVDDEGARRFAENLLARKGLDGLRILAAEPCTEGSHRWAALGRLAAALDRAAAAKKLEELGAAAKDRVWGEKLTQLAKHVASGADTSSATAIRIEEILAPLRTRKTIHASDAEVDALVALGRPAVPALMAALAKESKTPGAASRAVEDALAEVAVPADVPALRKLLLGRITGAATPLGELASEGLSAARDALLDAVDADVMSREVGAALERFEAPSRLRLGLVAWCGRQRAPGPDEAGPVAALLARLRPPGAREALARFLDVKLAPDAATDVAVALAELGEPRALPALVAAVRGGPSADRRRSAVSALDAISGLRHAALVRGGAKDEAALFAAAASDFDAWWAKAKDGIRYDDPSETWVVPGSGADAALAQQIRKAMSKARLASEVDALHPSVGDLTALGRAAVPLLVDELCATDDDRAGSALAYALAALVSAEDVPLLRTVLLAGGTGAAVPLGQLAGRGAPAAEAALLAAVAADVFDARVGQAMLDGVAPEARGGPVAAWLRRNAASAGPSISWALFVIGRNGGDGYADLVASLQQHTDDPATIYWIAQTLVGEGDVRGVPLLIDVVGDRHRPRDGGPRRGFPLGYRVTAARWLDWLSDLDHWRITDLEPGDTADEIHFRRAAVEFDAWWKRAAKDLHYDKAEDRWSNQRPGKGDELAAKVQEIARSESFEGRPPPDHPAVRKVLALGRDGVAAMLALLERPSTDGKTRALIAVSLAKTALPEDIPALRAHLLSRRTEVAPALGRLAADQLPLAASALLDAISAGIMDRDFDRITQGIPRDQLGTAVLAWCARRVKLDTGSIAAAASILSYVAPKGAADALAPLAAKVQDPEDVHLLGRTLVGLGDPRGFPLLVRAAANRDQEAFATRAVRDYSHAQRHDALERIASAADLTFDGVFEADGAGPVPASQEPAFAAAAEQAAAWWEKNGARLAWDEKTMSWRLAKRK